MRDLCVYKREREAYAMQVFGSKNQKVIQSAYIHDSVIWDGALYLKFNKINHD
jgi:hypothetical protein